MEALSPKAQGRRAAWLATSLSTLGLVADLFDISVINLVRPCLVATYGHMRPGQEGVLMAASVAGAVLGQTAFGPLADAHGRRVVFVATAGITALASLGCALATPLGAVGVYDVLAFWRFILGVGVGGEYPLSAANIAENVQARTSSQSLAFMLAGRSFGSVLGALVLILYSGVLHMSDYMLWRAAFGTGVLLAALCATLRYLYLPETIAFQAARAAEPKDQMASGAALVAMAPTLLGTSGCWFLYDISNYGVGIFTTAIFPSKPGLDTARLMLQIIGMAAPLMALGIVLSSIMRMRHLLLLGLGLQMVCYIAMASLADGWGFDEGRRGHALVLFALSRGFEHLGPSIAVFSVPAQVFPTRIRATAHGLSAAAGKLGAVAGAMAFPYMKEVFGIGGVMAAMAAVCLLNITWSQILVPSYGPRELQALATLEAAGLPLPKQAAAAQRILAGDPEDVEDLVGRAVPISA